MNVQVTPLTEFVHGRFTAYQGRPLMLNESLAQDLERRGLVRISLVKTPEAEPGKSQDDGPGPLSSASPAAQVLPTATLHLSSLGGVKTRKTGK